MENPADALPSLHDNREVEPTGLRCSLAISTSSYASPSQASSPGTSSTIWTSTTPSPAPSSLKKAPGHQKESAVWWYIEENASGSCVCQVELPPTDKNPSGGICECVFKGKSTSTLKGHIRAFHPAEAAIMDAHDKEMNEKKKQERDNEAKMRQPKKAKAQQSSLAAIPQSSKWEPHRYDKNSPVYRKITEHLAFLVGITSVPNSIVENEAFRNLINQLDPRYAVPGRKTIGKEISKLAESMRANIMTHMSSARVIHFCVNSWSKRGQTSTYLRITAHFFSYENQESHTVLIGLREMLRRHTGDYIREVFTEVTEADQSR